jgi:predicted DNA-binding transcriptional regulator AlpA
MQESTQSQVCLDRRAAACLAGMSVSWLRHADSIGSGPPKLRLGTGPGRIRYPLNEFRAWLAKHQDAAPGSVCEPATQAPVNAV